MAQRNIHEILTYVHVIELNESENTDNAKDEEQERQTFETHNPDGCILAFVWLPGRNSLRL